ncbi:hypothetical protein [Glaciihabitans sp. UYNi722]|uniref:hypothetical protein n=1 Tax=Glaciihabitans sp. UYNi722 TaxID=3156344 RepID=UPI00339A2425
MGSDAAGPEYRDTVTAVLRRCAEIETVRTYRQPPVGHSDDRAIEGLLRVLDRVCAIHVFSWWPGRKRRELAYRSSFWERVVDITSVNKPGLDAFLEFVRDDDPVAFARDADSLRQFAR